MRRNLDPGKTNVWLEVTFNFLLPTRSYLRRNMSYVFPTILLCRSLTAEIDRKKPNTPVSNLIM